MAIHNNDGDIVSYYQSEDGKGRAINDGNGNRVGPGDAWKEAVVSDAKGLEAEGRGPTPSFRPLREGKVVITGISAVTGQVRISPEMLARTLDIVKGSADPEAQKEKEAATTTLGLGIKYNTIPNVGETPETAAVLAVVNLLLSNPHIDPPCVNLVLGTESFNDKSASGAVGIVAKVNKVSAWLEEGGIRIGRLPLEGILPIHNQSACIGAERLIQLFARLGVDRPTIVVASGVGEYRDGSNASRTRGYGAAAYLVEPAITAKDGLLVYSATGSSIGDSTDFIKPIDKGDSVTGLGLSNNSAIVEGPHSNDRYTLEVIKSVKDIFSKAGFDINDVDVFRGFIFSAHTATPSLVNKKFPASLVEHLMRHDARFREKVEAEIKAAHPSFEHMPSLDGFGSQEEALEFMAACVEIGQRSGRIAKEIRDRDASLGARNDETINKNGAKIIAIKLEKLHSIMHRFRLDPSHDAGMAVMQAIGNMEALKGKGRLCADDIVDAASCLYDAAAAKSTRGVVNRMMKAEKEFVDQLKGTQTFKDLCSGWGLAESTALPSMCGNPYTSNKGISEISQLSLTPLSTLYSKLGLHIVYGSGAEGGAYMTEAIGDIRPLKAQAEAAYEYETGNKHDVSDGEYERLLREDDLDRVAVGMDGLRVVPPLQDINGELYCNKEELLEYVRGFLRVLEEKRESVSVAPVEQAHAPAPLIRSKTTSGGT